MREIKLDERMGYDTRTKTSPKGLENAIRFHYSLGISKDMKGKDMKGTERT